MDYKDKFIERTNKHIELVNKYAQKIGHTYLHHDNDKLGFLLNDYSLMFKDNITDDEQLRYDKATIKHITSNPHHPEFFLNRIDMEKIQKFSRKNPIMNLNCSKMTLPAIDEMCCDWCAMSEEFGNTPFWWADNQIGLLNKDENKRWLFTNKQLDYIYNNLERLWN